MELIVTHISADFDSLASVYAAGKLYPDAKIVLPGSPERNVRKFLEDYSDKFRFEKEKKVNIKDVEKLIVVETRSKSRLGKIGEVIGKKGVEVHVYDHHPPSKGDIKGSVDIQSNAGATTSIFVEMLRDKNIPIDDFEATLFAAGIYEDTGSLSFPSTTDLDREAVRFLISKNANLGIVSHYINLELNGQQISILRDLIHSLETHFVGSLKILIATASTGKYVGDIAVLAHKLREMQDLDGLFILVSMGKRLQIVARSQVDEINVGEICSLFNGGGHPKAASAHCEGIGLEVGKERLITALKKKVKVGKRVVGVEEIKHEEHIPIFKKDITGLMKKRLPKRLLALLRVIGNTADRLNYPAYVVGGFVRDLLLNVENFDIDVVVEGDGIEFAKVLSEHFEADSIIHRKFGTGAVTIHDVDKALKRMGEKFTGKGSKYNVPSSLKIDIATARKEYYESPAILPTVEFGSIKEDLYRRDFSINAMAMKINKEGFGMLIDFFGGEKDLDDGSVRVLHNLSFIEDPTRIFRAIRFEQRFSFKIELGTRKLVQSAGRLEMFDRLTNQRIRDEVILILNERDPVKAVKRMIKLHGLDFVHPNLKFGKRIEDLYSRIRKNIEWFENSFNKEVDNWILNFAVLLSNLKVEEVELVCEKLVLTREAKSKINQIVAVYKDVSRRLDADKSLISSALYRQLNAYLDETLIFVMSYSKSSRVPSRIRKYLTQIKPIKLSIGGKDLKKMGFKTSPYLKEVLNKVLYAKIDGKISTRSQELKLAKSMKIRNY